ncbi:MAG: S-layer homology domain-containing protein [Oscillospiraceae bacterium]|nr:S-layer homology domain-containing protein [Oscillospiraceae bacterium]
MKKGIFKRSLSFVLTLALVAGLLPQTAFFASAASSVTYDFTPRMINRCETGVLESTKLNPRDITAYFEEGASAKYPTYSRNWKYFAETLSSAVEMHNTYGTYYDGGSFGAWVAFKVKGLTKGSYSISMGRYDVQKKGCVYGLYILDANKYTTAAAITAALDDANAEGIQKVGEADTYASSASSVSFGTAELHGNAQTEHIVVVRAERAGTVDEGEEQPTNSSGNPVKSYCFVAFRSLTFELIEVLDKIEAKNINAVTGNKIEPQLSWFSTSETECADEKIIDEIELVGNSDGALVLGQDKNLYAVKPGTATFRVTGHLKSNLGGKKTSNTATVTVSENNEIRSGNVFDWSLTAKPIITNETSGRDFEFAGTSTIKVNPKSLVEYFSNATGTYSRNWKFFTETLNSASPDISDNNGMYFEGDKKFDDILVLKIKGIDEGVYNISVRKPSENRKGCVWGLYLLDAEKYTEADDIKAAIVGMSDGVQKAGEVDTYGSSAATLGFGSLSFSGTRDTEHLLVFRAEREGVVDEGESAPLSSNGTVVLSSTEFIAITGLTFDGTYTDSVDTNLTYTKLGKGETSRIVSTTGTKNTGDVIADMSAMAFVNYEVVEGKDAVRLEDDGKTLTAIESGTAILETTVIHDGRVITDRDEITVGDNFGVSALLTSGSTTAYIGKRFRLSPLVELGDGTQIIPAGAVVSYTVVDGKEYVSADGDTLVAGNEAGTAKVKMEAEFRGKKHVSEEFTVSVVDELEPLSGNTYTYTADGISFDGKDGTYRCAVIDIPADGRYQVTLNANTNKTSGIVTFYAIPYSAEVQANPKDFLYGAYKLFSADLYKRSLTTLDIPLDDAVFDVGGKYLLFMQVTGKNNLATGYDVSINNITFDGESYITSVVADVDALKLGIEETTGFKISAYLSNGIEVPVEDAVIEYAFDQSVLSVNEEKMTVTTSSGITGTTSADMTASVTYKGYTAEKTVTFTIDKSFGAAPGKPALLFGDTSFALGSKITFTPAVELLNRTVVQVYDENVKYEIVKNDDGAVEFDTEGVLRAVMPGQATVRMIVPFRGKLIESETADIIVTENVSVKNLEINFTKGGHVGDGFETLDNALSYTLDRSWIFHEIVGNDKTQPLKMETAQAQLNFNPAEDDKYLVLKIRVSGSGEYNVTAFSNRCRSRAGQFDMYVFPATAENMSDIPSKLVEENYVGYMDFYNETTSSIGVPSEIIDVKKGFKLATGEYAVVLNLVPRAGSTIKDSRGDVVYPTYIRFTDVNSMASAKLLAANEIDVDTQTSVNVEMFNCNGSLLAAEPDSVSFYSSDTSVATVSEIGTVTGISEGVAEIRAYVTYGDVTLPSTCEVYVKDTSELLGISLSVPESLYIYGSSQIYALAEMGSGKTVSIPEKYITWTVSDENIAEIADGRITGKDTGTVTVSAVISDEYKTGASSTVIAPVPIEITWDSKATPSLFTIQKRENAKNNAKKYSWARDLVKSATTKADMYLENFDILYDMIVPEGLPRYYHVGNKYDEGKYRCRYCNYDIGANVNIYGWTANPFGKLWKIQCPGCLRVFPSNDFGKFYQLGITESGSWNYEKALQTHHEMFVCEDTENGNECTHTPPAKNAPKAGSQQWIQNDPRDAEWYAYYGYGVAGGYLNNDLYGEMDKKLGVSGWGVDDGFGYRQPYVSDPSLPGYNVNYNDDDGDGYARFVSGSKEGPVQHTYIAYYLHEGVWLGAGGFPQSQAILKNAMSALRDAFLYTGDAKYGRAGAILLDKIADMFPGYDWYQWKYFRGDNVRGTIADGVWGTTLTIIFTECCDAFLPMYNDQYVIDYLKEKRARYEIDEETGDWKRDADGNLIPVNPKDSPGAIRKNAEDGILIESYNATKQGKLYANFGPEQETVGTAAIALNRMPETGEMLDWVFNYGEPYNEGDYKGDVTGGDVLNKIIDDVDRDGNGGENAPQYNLVWAKNLANLSEKLTGYELYQAEDLFKNPKYVKMLTAQARLTLGGYYTPQTGDSGYTASRGMYINLSAMLTAFKHTNDRLLARAIWKYNNESLGGNIANLHGSLFDEDAEKVMRDIEAIVEEDGEFALGSDLMAGYGFAALRAGAKYDSASSVNTKNTNRDFAIYFGATDFHGHSDSLNLYISAFGLNMAPDLGYPASTGVEPNRFQWVRTTLSHNTVTVDETQQMTKGETATPHHFDDAGRVRLFDASADVYAQTDEYRRSLIMVDVGDDVSYGVDFFHVRGGNDHLYSFHSQSDEICDTVGLDSMSAPYPTYDKGDGTLIGTYAGANVQYGGDPGGNAPNNVYPLGYTWLKNIRTCSNPEKDFAVEFKLKDWNRVLDWNHDLRLRMTMLSDEAMDEVTFATARPPQRGENSNIGELEYVLVRNKGKNLDTTFTTVFEPYISGNKYIRSIRKLPMVRSEDSRPGLYDSFSAVRVELQNGRVDYVIYSTNTTADYTVTDDCGSSDTSDDIVIKFRGFAGVMTVDCSKQGNPKVSYRYLNDGEVLRLETEREKPNVYPSAYTGKVDSFTTSLSTENSIVISPDGDMDISALSGRYVYIENDGVGNGAYRIESAEPFGNNVKLNLGNVSLIRRYIEPTDRDSGYVYNIAKGQTLRIPMSELEDNAPTVDRINDFTVSVGSAIEIPFRASATNGKELSFEKSVLPRGMSVDSEKQLLIWKPSASQVGDNHVELTVSDGTLEATVHFTVTVYGSTTGAPSQNEGNEGSTDTPDTPSGDTSGGGSGGGGGAASAPDTGDDTKPDDSETTKPDDGNTDAGEVVPTVPTKGFVDLGSHAWAEDAIAELADAGIIKGTSETTFSPANNITRADFALLLVRAFDLKSDSTENFADVSESDYFASELAIARNCGIVGGIGDNKYAPRNTITRQDMMVIVYRALKTLGIELETGEVSYPDFTDVAPYAKDAVSALITAGLVNGKNDKIDPTAYTTRAEVAVLIKRISDYIGK